MFDDLFIKADMKQRAKCFQVRFTKEWLPAGEVPGDKEDSWSEDVFDYESAKGRVADFMSWVWQTKEPPDQVVAEIYADYGLLQEDEGGGHDTSILDRTIYHNPNIQ